MRADQRPCNRVRSHKNRSMSSDGPPHPPPQPEYQTPPDASLRMRARVAACREGRPGAFEDLYQASMTRLEKIAASLGPPPEGSSKKDLLQSAWVGQLGRLLDKAGPEIADSTHFFRLAARAIWQARTDLGRRMRKRVRLRNGPLDKLERVAREEEPPWRPDLEEALEALPELTRAVFVTWLSGERTRQSIAEEFGMSEAGVRKQVADAKATLAARLAAYRSP